MTEHASTTQSTPILLDKIDKTREFKTEKQMCDYIEFNAEYFCRDVIEADYISHKREFYMATNVFGGGNKPRCDFMFVTNKGNFLVEVKNFSSGFSEQVAAIGQVLAYQTMGVNIEKVILAANTFAPIVPKTIENFELPITLAIIRKNMIATWSYNG